MLPHRAVGFATEVERVVLGVRRRVGPQIRPDRAVAFVKGGILALAVALVGIERAQLFPQRRVVRRTKRVRCLTGGNPMHCRRTDKRTRTSNELFSCQAHQGVPISPIACHLRIGVRTMLRKSASEWSPWM